MPFEQKELVKQQFEARIIELNKDNQVCRTQLEDLQKRYDKI